MELIVREIGTDNEACITRKFINLFISEHLTDSDLIDYLNDFYPDVDLGIFGKHSYGEIIGDMARYGHLSEDIMFQLWSDFVEYTIKDIEEGTRCGEAVQFKEYSIRRRIIEDEI